MNGGHELFSCLLLVFKLKTEIKKGELKMDQQFVYQLGDGSRLCVKCLKNYLDEIGEPNNITNGQILSLENGLPLYGWNIGKCTEDKCISRKEKENED